MRAILGCLCVTFLAIPIHASALTGTDLYTYCSSPDTSALKTICISYVRGLSDGLALADVMAASGTRYCPPEGSTVLQDILIVQKYLGDHPEQLNRTAGVLAALSLYAAFPCK